MTAVGMVVGIDAVDTERFRSTVDRSPRLVLNAFTDLERAYAARAFDPSLRLAVRFAAKEAAMKALGTGLGGCSMREIEVDQLPSGQPVLRLWGRAHHIAEQRGLTQWSISLSHSELTAIAIVIGSPAGLELPELAAELRREHDPGSVSQERGSE